MKTAYDSRAWRALCVLAYEVYGYWCYRCQQPIDPDLPATHRLSKTVDHTLEVKHVGKAVPDIADVRPMHRACNSAKEAASRRQSIRVPSRVW